MFSSLGRWSFRHPYRVFAVWIVVGFAALAAAGSLGSAYEAAAEIPDAESQAGFDIIDEHFGGVGAGLGGSIVFEADAGVTDPEVQQSMTALLADIDDLEGVTVTSPYDDGGDRLIAGQGPRAGEIAYAEVALDPSIDQTEAGEVGSEIVSLVDESGLNNQDGLAVEVGGAALAEQHPPESEAIGLAFAVFVLILAMGSVIAMGTTIGVALVGVTIGVAGIIVLSNVTSIPDFAVTIGLMIGLGVGIDYALFIVNRYRESIRAGFGPEDATAVALDTAGRSVVFAGATVVVSLLGLLLMGLPFVAGLGISAAATVAAVMAGSVTLLPAVIGLVGDRIQTTRWRGVVASGFVAMALVGFGIGVDPLLVGLPLALITVVAGSIAGSRNPLHRELPARNEKPLRETGWYSLSRLVQARPWAFAVGGTAVLLLLAAPVLDLRLGFSDEGNYAEETTTRQAYDLLAEGFGPGANGPLLIATEVDDAADLEALGSLSQTLNATDGVAFATPPQPSPDGEAALIQVQPTTSPQDEATDDLVESLRDDVIPASMANTELAPQVTGIVASNIDFTSFLAGRIPIFFGAVLGASFLLLMAVFRSVLVPLKAVIMNMLSIGAAYGVVVAVFQWGWFGNVLGVEPAPIEPFVPMMLFAVLFGLSMDYEVFLLSRMKEEYEKTGDPVNSVADGLAATARVITAAAAIMVVVFGSFVFNDARTIKLFGLGLSTAVLIDASLVRMLIVPSTMELLGARNWWLPRWLDRIIPNLNIEGGDHHPPTEPEGSPSEPPLDDRELEPAPV